MPGAMLRRLVRFSGNLKDLRAFTSTFKVAAEKLKEYLKEVLKEGAGADTPADATKARDQSPKLVCLDGTLMKERDFVGGWRPREFILKGTKLDYYVPGSRSNKPKRSVSVVGAKVTILARTQAEFGFSVYIADGGYCYKLRGSSEKDRRRWVQAIRLAASPPGSNHWLRAHGSLTDITDAPLPPPGSMAEAMELRHLQSLLLDVQRRVSVHCNDGMVRDGLKQGPVLVESGAHCLQESGIPIAETNMMEVLASPKTNHKVPLTPPTRDFERGNLLARVNKAISDEIDRPCVGNMVQSERHFDMWLRVRDLEHKLAKISGRGDRAAVGPLEKSVVMIATILNDAWTLVFSGICFAIIVSPQSMRLSAVALSASGGNSEFTQGSFWGNIWYARYFAYFVLARSMLSSLRDFILVAVALAFYFAVLFWLVGSVTAWQTMSGTATTAANDIVTYPMTACIAAAGLCVDAKIQAIFGRTLAIYSLAGTIIGTYVVTRLTLRRLGCSNRRSTLCFKFLHSIFAPLLYNRIITLRSVWLKFGQQMAGMPDVIPDEYCRILGRLHDKIPQCPVSYVRRTLERDFGKPMDEIFDTFDDEAIASASIAQVHRGKLKDTALSDEVAGGKISLAAKWNGNVVAVKVQHRGIRPIIKTDFVAAIRLAKVAGYFNDEYAVMKEIVTEGKKVAVKELTFTNEAENLKTVRQNLAKGGFIFSPGDPKSDLCIVPEPCDALVGESSLVMTFEKGFKITDSAALDELHIDRTALMQRVVQIYAQKLLIDGFFNADPHPGNVFVTIRNDKNGNSRFMPVLLDFGITINMTKDVRLGFCEIVYGIHTADLDLLQEGFRHIGYSDNLPPELKHENMSFMSFATRNTGRRDTSREESVKFFERQMEIDAKFRKDGWKPKIVIPPEVGL